MDASFALDLMASMQGEESSPVARAMAGEALLAPAIFWLEFASGLRNLALRREITAAFRLVMLDRVRAMGILTEATSSRVEPVIEVSDRFQLTIYDAAYLELAIRTGSGMATHDSGLIEAAPRAGVRLAMPT